MFLIIFKRFLSGSGIILWPMLFFVLFSLIMEAQNSAELLPIKEKTKLNSPQEEKNAK